LIAIRKLLLSLAILALCVSARPASAQGSQRWTPDAILTMMDHAAQDFHSLTANIERIKYTDVVKDTSTETGQLWVRKDDKMRIQIVKPDPRTVLRSGDSLYIFNPKINRVEEYDLGKNREMVDQYLELGFNTRGEHLKKNYLVAINGEQELDGRKTVLIELTPKSEKTREQITKIQMWVDTGSWMPIQQKFFEANSGDYFIIHYTGVMKNLKIEDSRFKPDWPKNATKVKPRG
jgi:outer membrane lipoprotein-sorting protein